MFNLQTKVSKKKALEIIRANRIQHKKDFEDASIEYHKTVVVALEEKLKQATSGKDVTLAFSLSKPVQYLTEYDKAIKMLELTTDTTIEMDPQTFDCLINDNWGWKQNFLNNTGLYLKK